MRSYLKNNPAKLHSDLIWNDGALGFFEQGRPNNNKFNKKSNNNKMSSTALLNQFLFKNTK